MNKDQERKATTYWDIMRGAIAQDDYIAAIVLANEVKNRLTKTEIQETADTVYSALLEVVDELHIRNPFSDKDRFFFIYQEGKQRRKIDWESEIERAERFLRMPILPVPIVKIFERCLC